MSETKVNQSVLLVGKKPAMNYCLFLINQMKESNEITIKARGKAIQKAVDVVEILRRRFITNLQIKDIKLGTEQIDDKEKNIKRNVSTIEIIFSK